MDIKAQYFVYKPFNGKRTKYQLRKQIGEYEH